MSDVLKSESVHIREILNDNLEEDFPLNREIVDDYPYSYVTLKDNIDMLKLVQLGLTFFL
ncbi:putative ribonuclease H-like superfamily, CCR4-NOT transcription complex subunit/Pop2 [Helianthus annuus]|nr:putative ribonuclease H-like superfamily, CCR4-NOT transcription complex subunit/Pop2 [Helianthus annuus]